MTAISVEPPPMSTIMLPSGASTSMPIPTAAAIGSKMRYTSRPSACSAESRTARSSTSVEPEGTPITMRREGEKRWRPRGTIFIRPRIIISHAEKSAITPSRSGRTVLMRSLVFSYMLLARSPTAIIWLLSLSIATTDGSSTTILSSEMMIVFAVPRSIAISCTKEKNPISCLNLNVISLSLSLWKCAQH